MAYSEQISKPILNSSVVLESYKISNNRTFLFDYDGTLTPIVKDPADALPSTRLITALRSLSSDPKNTIWIISGRDQQFLTKHFDTFTEIGLSAEHGCFIHKPGTSGWECLVSSEHQAWQADVEAVFQEFTARTPGSWIERKKIAVTWHYRNVETGLGEERARQCREVLQNIIKVYPSIEIISGKCNIEIRPTDINKGKIIEYLVSNLPPSMDHLDFILCLGDDETDEDMFRALSLCITNQENIFTCRVGTSDTNTSAKFCLPTPVHVVELLSSLADLRE